ncbi:hypothetical protein PR048_012559 [Dryococelus australis]|uniref:Reverse transcriptase domain-containing protein n=1 Tax=Dryococelus australis TaxID=614101 RepID=A0ABQ9HPQ4_9NEOP|nr:hypothetical protein PR048_012559 [Dryococelus australis]
MGHGLYHPDILMAAVDAAESGEPVVGITDNWFRKVFLVEDCVKPLPENLDHPFEGTRRQQWEGGETSTEEVRRSRLKGQTSPDPDGITVSEWDKVPDDLKPSLFNLSLVKAVLEWMFAARTVLKPKVSQLTVAADFRPISIASVLWHFRKVLGAQIQSAVKIKPEQRAFIEDSLSENITLLAEVLHGSTSWGKLLYAVVLDVRKAFDMVSHAPLMEVLRARRLPHNILRHNWQLYLVGKTTIQLPGKICHGVPVKQGCGKEICCPPSSSTSWEERLFSRLAFADDVVVLAGSRAGLQSNLDRLKRALERFGLRLSAVKSFSLAMAAVPRERRVKVLDEQMFRIETEGGVKAFEQDLEGPLERISAAPLKPFQLMELLKVFLFPSFIYRMSFAKVTMGALKACDVLIREAVRRWLKLPLTLPWDSSMLRALRGVWAFPVWSYLYVKVEWARAVATVGGVTLYSSLKFKNYWRARWSRSVGGADLETARSCRESTAWIGHRASGIPSKDSLSYLHIISNSLPSAIRTSRGRGGPTGALPKCRAGCNDDETMYHVIQQCPRTHETRVARHNKVLKVVAGGARIQVLREPRYRTSEGVGVPDMVVSKPVDDVAHVLDVQVVQSKGMDWSFSR